MSRAIDDQDNDISSEDNSQDELSDKISLQDLPVEVKFLNK